MKAVCDVLLVTYGSTVVGPSIIMKKRIYFKVMSKEEVGHFWDTVYVHNLKKKYIINVHCILKQSSSL